MRTFGRACINCWHVTFGSACIIFASITSATTLTSSAQVQIVDELSVAELKKMDFGVIDSRNGKCRMDVDGALTGSDGQNCSGLSIPGEFRISGSQDQLIEISVESSSPVDGIVFNPELADGPAYTLSSEGETTIKVVGELVLNSATAGAKSISYTLTANYQ